MDLVDNELNFYYRPPPKNASGPRTNGAIPNRAKVPGRIQDARIKIIQKKRTHIADARDKLAQIAKQSDARLKLQKMRGSGPKKIDPASIRRTSRNGRVSLTTNKPPPSRTPRSMPPAFIPPPTRSSMSYRAPPLPDSHYVNEMLMKYTDSKFSLLIPIS